MKNKSLTLIAKCIDVSYKKNFFIFDFDGILHGMKISKVNVNSGVLGFIGGDLFDKNKDYILQLHDYSIVDRILTANCTKFKQLK